MKKQKTKINKKEYTQKGDTLYDSSGNIVDICKKVKYDFHNQSFNVIQVLDKIFVAIAPLCDLFDLNDEFQIEQIKYNKEFKNNYIIIDKVFYLNKNFTDSWLKQALEQRKKIEDLQLFFAGFLEATRLNNEKQKEKNQG